MSMIESRDFAVASTLGMRETQEDDWGTHADPPAMEEGACLLAAVADGMGGAPAGDRASQIVIRAFLDGYLCLAQPARARLRGAMLRANKAIECAAQASPELAGMGATLVAALFFPDRCEWLSVGDSLILLCRDGKAERVNPLHIYANALDAQVQRGGISAEQARMDPDRNALTSVLIGGSVDEVAQGNLRLQPGDLVLLASDGITFLPEEEIAAACMALAAEDASRIAETLIARIDALQREGQDNATLVVVRRPADEANTARIRGHQRGQEGDAAAALGNGKARTKQPSTSAGCE